MTSALSDAARAALSASGAFASAQDTFNAREGQLEMAGAVADAIARNDRLVIEAGTGTGKTYAYLVPALLAQSRVMISTGSRTLQDQLYQRDIPAVLAALSMSPQIALLKGRNNYVCHHHLERNLAQGRFESRRDLGDLHRISRFAAISESGDLSETAGISEASGAWRMASSTRENCLGQDCDYIDRCFVYKARRKAMQADVVIVNHHLFCADLAMRDDGVSELLPQMQVVIFDEAHQLPDVATNFFGQALSSRQLLDFARDMMRIGREDAADAADWIALSGGIENRLRTLRLSAGDMGRLDEKSMREARVRPLLAELDGLASDLQSLAPILISAAERSRDLERLGERLAAIRGRLDTWMRRIRGEALGEGDDDVQTQGQGNSRIAGRTGHIGAAGASVGAGAVSRAANVTSEAAATATVNALEATRSQTTAADMDAAVSVASRGSHDTGALDPLAGDPPEPDAHDDGEDPLSGLPLVAWAEVSRQGLTLHLTPVEVGPLFRREVERRPMSWVFTSATLSAANGFDHYLGAMGLEGADCLAVASPFDFKTQALLYVPPNLPLPRDGAFADSLARAVAPLLQANAGRAFILCTTLRMVRELAEALALLCPGTDDESEFQWLVQGQEPRPQLLEKFRAEVRPVLIGSASFWEGVDVVGQQLSMVVIDKLPFAPPEDPVLRARGEAMRKRGQDPFRHLHLPRAAMALKQGAGRLIRSETDQGLLLIGDCRLAEKAYGRMLLRSLPPFSRTRDPQSALDFLLGRITADAALGNSAQKV